MNKEKQLIDSGINYMKHSFSAEKNFLSPIRNKQQSESKVRFNSQNYFKGTVCSPSANSYTRIFYSKRRKRIVKAFSPAPQKQMKKANRRRKMVSASQTHKMRKEKGVNDENVSVNSIYRQRLKGINNRGSNQAQKRSIEKFSLKKGKKKNSKGIDQKLKLYYSELDQMCRKRGLQKLAKIFKRGKQSAFAYIMSTFRRKKIKISISKRTPVAKRRNYSNERSITSIKRKLFASSHRAVTRKSAVERVENVVKQPAKFDYDFNNFMGIHSDIKKNHFATFAHNGDDSFQRNEDYAEMVVERSKIFSNFSNNFSIKILQRNFILSFCRNEKLREYYKFELKKPH